MTSVGRDPDLDLRLYEFTRLEAEWAQILRPSPIPAGAWAADLARMQATMHELQDRGLWARGPHDLLSIVGLQTWELAHSAALAWLCDPQGSHGLGGSFLASLLATTGGEMRIARPIVDTEVSRSESRADIVVSDETWTLVIEVKVNASEGDDQADRLYRDWCNEPGVRFLFLTRHGNAPKTATAASRSEWATVSWTQVHRTLTEAALLGPQNALGRRAMDDYLQTLRSTF